MGFWGWAILIVGGGIAIGVIKAIADSNNKKNAASSIQTVDEFTPTDSYVDSEGGSLIAFDESRRKILLGMGLGAKMHKKAFAYKDILSAELLEDGISVTKTSRTSQAATALLGGILFGGVGAVVGALTSTTTTAGKVKRLDLKIVVNDTQAPVYLVNFQNVEAKKGGIINKAAVEQAQKWAAILTVIMRQADEADKEAGRAVQALPAPSRADELERLATLREKGILTDAEFTSEKQKLLST